MMNLIYLFQIGLISRRSFFHKRVITKRKLRIFYLTLGPYLVSPEVYSLYIRLTF